jgi:DNA processing protein
MDDQHVDSRIILWLQQLKGISAKHIQAIYSYFDSFEEIFTSSESELAACLDSNALHIIVKNRHAFIHLEDELGQLISCWQQQQISLLPITSPDYPELLRSIHTPPHLLFVRGPISSLSMPQLAIVGSRNYTASGGENARTFARELASSGFTITSGLALGIDSMAHLGAVETGKTIAVLGAGVETIYPRSNQQLADKILATEGTLISEFAPGTPPRPAHFPQRNRIISGLSMGVLVVEAALKSGSLITARIALEQGREVFAIPSSIHNPMAKGCHQLIRNGASLVENINDIIEQLQGMVAFKREELEQYPKTESAEKAPQAELLEKMGFDPIDFDELIARGSAECSQLLQQLTELELSGYIEQRGSHYIRIK